MVGFAATATFRSAAIPTKSTYASLEAQVELFEQLAGPAVVVFQDLDDPAVGATFGEVMCSTYKAFGWDRFGLLRRVVAAICCR